MDSSKEIYEIQHQGKEGAALLNQYIQSKANITQDMNLLNYNL